MLLTTRIVQEEFKKNEMSRLLLASCNNGNLDLLIVPSQIIDLNRTNTTEVAIENGLVSYVESFWKYGMSIPAHSLCASVYTKNR
jgi:ABC-type thiamine transport system ATPase subunit